MEAKKLKQKEEEIVDFNIKEFLLYCLSKWYWFFICVTFAVGIALFYIYYKQPEYNRYEQILLNKQSSEEGAISNSFSSLGLFSKNSNVYNELLSLTSPAILYQVADSLELYMNYRVRDGLRYKTLYGSNLPFKIEMTGIGRQQNASFKLKVEPDGSMEAYKFVRYIQEKKVKYNDKIRLNPGTKEFESPLGVIKIMPNPSYVPNDKDKEDVKVYNIGKLAMQSTVELYSLKLSGDLANDDADVIELSIEDVSVQRAVDILNYILIVYKQNWIADKQKQTSATSAFIDERLAVIESQLGDIDRSIANYMKESGTPDIYETAKINMTRGASLEEQLISLSNQLSIANYMKEFLDENNNFTTILPVNLGLNASDLAVQIETYNELLLNRENIISSSSVTNPLVENYDRQLRQMRIAIEQTVGNRIANIETSIANVQKELGIVYKYNANAPETQLPLLSEQRQREIKRSLYLYLLQKQEENEITKTYSSDNLKVITPPIGPLAPVSPRKGLIIIVGIILGLGVPFVLLYYLQFTDSTVQSKKDLSALIMGVVGEIPSIGVNKKFNFLNKKLRKQKVEDEGPVAVVEEGNGNSVNESFRIVRGNLDFMIGKSAEPQVIMVTSTEVGSGKTFIAYNLSLSYALKGKKTLLIDGDGRKGALSRIISDSGSGIFDYLKGNVLDWHKIVKSTSQPNLSIIPEGSKPSNPTELLENERMENLINELKKDFDIIIIDSPSVNLYADAQIIASMANRTLFVIRAGEFEKSELQELNSIYEENRFNNMCVVLNGKVSIDKK